MMPLCALADINGKQAAAESNEDVQSNDLYRRLDVSRMSSVEELKKSYRRLAMKYHPDRNPHFSHDLLQNINEAYAILSDVESRTRYNSRNPYAGLSTQSPRSKSESKAWRQWSAPEFEKADAEAHPNQAAQNQQPNSKNESPATDKNTDKNRDNPGDLNFTTTLDWAAWALSTSPDELNLKTALEIFSQKMPLVSERDFLLALSDLASSGPRPPNHALAAAAQQLLIYRARFAQFMKTCKSALSPD